MTAAQVIEKWEATLEQRRKTLDALRQHIRDMQSSEGALLNEIDRDEHALGYIKDLLEREPKTT